MQTTEKPSTGTCDSRLDMQPSHAKRKQRCLFWELAQRCHVHGECGEVAAAGNVTRAEDQMPAPFRGLQLSPT